MLIRIDENEWMIQEPDEVKARWEEFEGILDHWGANSVDSLRYLQDFVQSCPDHVDAIHHLAMYHFEIGNILEAILLEKSAVEKVTIKNNKEIDFSKVNLSWELIENRPFLRALHGLGIFQLKYTNCIEAEKSLKQLLLVNKRDNLGGRYSLVKLAFESCKPEIVLRISSEFPDDRMPELTYGKALAYIQLKQMGLARTTLYEAISYQPKVANSLIQKIVKAEDLSAGYIVIGGEDQAFAYRREYSEYWRNTPGAISLLKSIYEK